TGPGLRIGDAIDGCRRGEVRSPPGDGGTPAPVRTPGRRWLRGSGLCFPHLSLLRSNEPSITVSDRETANRWQRGSAGGIAGSLLGRKGRRKVIDTAQLIG